MLYPLSYEGSPVSLPDCLIDSVRERRADADGDSRSRAHCWSLATVLP